MSQTRTGPEPLFRFLVAYRLLFYLGSLVAMSLPLGLAWLADVRLSPAARTTLVGVGFSVILLTYLAERRVGLDHVDPRTGAPTESYSNRMRASVVMAILGVAAGIYFLLAGRYGVGLLFLAGALLFFQMGYRSERDSAGDRG